MEVDGRAGRVESEPRVETRSTAVVLPKCAPETAATVKKTDPRAGGKYVGKGQLGRL